MKKSERILAIVFILAVIGTGLLFFILVNQSRAKGLPKDYVTMISSLVRHLTKAPPPTYQPDTLKAIEFLEEFRPIPPADPIYAKDGQRRMKAYKNWIEGRPQKVIDEIKSLSQKTDPDRKLLMAAYIKLDSLGRVEEMGRQIETKDSNTLKALAICATNSGRHTLALDYYRQLLQYEDHKDFAYEQIGNVYFKMGDTLKAVGNWELAVDQYQSVHRLPPQYLNFALGLAYYHQGNYDRARNYLAMIPQRNEYDLAARHYELLILSDQKNNKKLLELFEKTYIPSLAPSPEARNLLKAMIGVYYSLAADALSRDQIQDAKFYLKKALTALRLYEPDKQQNESIIFRYLKAIILRMTEELSKDDRNHRDSRIAFNELFETVKKQQKPSQGGELSAKLLGNILFMANEDSLSAAFYENVSLPDFFTQINLLTLKPELITRLNLNLPENCESDSCLFYFKLNLANIFIYNKKFHEARSLSNQLEHCSQFVRPSQHKLRDRLLLEHYSRLLDLTRQYYESQLKPITQNINIFSAQQASPSLSESERKLLELRMSKLQDDLRVFQDTMRADLDDLAIKISQLQRKPQGEVVYKRYVPLLRDATDPCSNRKSDGPDIIILFNEMAK